MNKILIVDDSAAKRRVNVRVAPRSGSGLDEVLAACHGVEARECLVQTTSIDRVLADGNIPTMDGMTFLEVVRIQRSKIERPMSIGTAGRGDTHGFECFGSWRRRTCWQPLQA